MVVLVAGLNRVPVGHQALKSERMQIRVARLKFGHDRTANFTFLEMRTVQNPSRASSLARGRTVVDELGQDKAYLGPWCSAPTECQAREHFTDARGSATGWIADLSPIMITGIAMVQKRRLCKCVRNRTSGGPWIWRNRLAFKRLSHERRCSRGDGHKVLSPGLDARMRQLRPLTIPASITHAPSAGAVRIGAVVIKLGLALINVGMAWQGKPGPS